MQKQECSLENMELERKVSLEGKLNSFSLQGDQRKSRELGQAPLLQCPLHQ